ncbi:hypothetical protein [Acinetobacter sp. YH12134]|uniref:hypothetical protein n=1 Tax=Acinetobacter sp. YH12134 TaxID=2601118 RepID=UPI0015D35638|nr:hypothetical protein [Acinetobacter sp. YH12134]
MKALKKYHEIDLRTFRVEISDFIHQEIYRCLQIKNKPDDVNKIIEIHSLLRKRLDDFNSVYVEDHIKEMAKDALDAIVLGCNKDYFTQYMKQSILNKEYAEQEFPWLTDNSGTEQEKEKRKEDLRQTLKDFLCVYDEYSDHKWSINLLYPPQLFIYEIDYEFVLEYLQNSEYLSTFVPCTDDITFINGPTITSEQMGNKLVINQTPFEVFKAYKRKVMNFDYDYEELEIPKAAISNKLNSEEFQNKEFTIQDFSNLSELYYQGQPSHTQVYSKLKVEVDMTLPLSQKELEETIERFRIEICQVQGRNRAAKMLLAENLEELGNAANQTKLESIDFYDSMEVFSSSPLNIVKVSEFKLLLCGLMVYKARWLDKMEEQAHWVVDSKIKFDLYNLCCDLSKSLVAIYKRGFSETNIERGYEQVSALINKKFKELYPNYKSQKTS